MSSIPHSDEIHQYSPPLEIPPILRPDLIEAYIELDKHNVEMLSKDFDRFVYDLTFACGGLRNAEPAFRAGKRTWSLTLLSDIAKLHIQLLLLGQSFDPASRGRGIPYPTKLLARKLPLLTDGSSWEKLTRENKRTLSDGIPRLNRIHNPLPSWSDLMRHGYKGSYLGKITISDRCKIYPAEYVEEAYEILEVIEQKWGIHLVAKRFEMAIDTLDESKGRGIFAQSTLKWADSSRQLFHVIKDSENPKRNIKIIGPALYGKNEYLCYRSKSRSDERTSSERPKGGRRQLHCYEKPTPWPDYPIYRTEVIFYTTYLRKWMKSEGVSTVRELIRRGADLVRQNVAFRCLDLDMLYLKSPRTKKLGLESLSFRGLCFKLSQAGISKEIVKSCILDQDNPLIPDYFAISDVHSLDLWESYHYRRQEADENLSDPSDKTCALFPCFHQRTGSTNNIGL